MHSLGRFDPVLFESKRPLLNIDNFVGLSMTGSLLEELKRHSAFLEV